MDYHELLLSYSNLGLAITPITHFKGRFSSLSKSLAIIYCVFRSATTWFPWSKKIRNLEKKRRRRAHEKWPLAIVAFFWRSRRASLFTLLWYINFIKITLSSIHQSCHKSLLRRMIRTFCKGFLFGLWQRFFFFVHHHY